MGSKLRWFMLVAALLVLVLTQAQAQAEAAAARRPRGVIRPKHRHLTNMVFYMHDLPMGTKPTAVVVAGQNGDLKNVKLGTTFIFDDKLTEGPDPNSAEIGRGEGLYSLASSTSADLLLVFTAMLYKPAIYNGSTICLQGSDRVFMPEREISIVGGTGAFRFARGFAILSTVSLSGTNAIIKFNLTMLL